MLFLGKGNYIQVSYLRFMYFYGTVVEIKSRSLEDRNELCQKAREVPSDLNLVSMDGNCDSVLEALLA